MTKTCASRGEPSQPLLIVRHEKMEVPELKHYDTEGQIHKEQIAEMVQGNPTLH